ncbi:MAG: glycosyltransferase family 39 protein, partial [Patescibacteria group bacterium]
MLTKFLLLCVFLLALLLRIVRLGDLPHGFFEEEVTNAYVGRFILQNGKDLYGNIFPLLYFDKFHDYPPVLPMYISGLGTFLFGNTEFAARFPIALIGALTIYPVFGLALILLGNVSAALFASFLLAILPWHVVLSRTGAEGVIGLYVYILALLWIFQKKISWAMVAFFLTYFLYPSFRILVPLTVLPLFFLLKPRKTLFIAGIGFILFTAVISMTEWGRGRFEQTSVFKSTEIRDRVDFLNTYFSNDEGTDQVRLARMFHNKGIGYAREIAKQYMSYFSPSHLFYEADGQPRYFNVPQNGLLYMTMALLFLAALIPIGKSIRPGYIAYVVYLLIIAPIPAVLTIDFVPHAH